MAREKASFERDLKRWKKDPELRHKYEQMLALIKANDVDGLAAVMYGDNPGRAARLAERARRHHTLVDRKNTKDTQAQEPQVIYVVSGDTLEFTSSAKVTVEYPIKIGGRISCKPHPSGEGPLVCSLFERQPE